MRGGIAEVEARRIVRGSVFNVVFYYNLLCHVSCQLVLPAYFTHIWKVINFLNGKIDNFR